MDYRYSYLLYSLLFLCLWVVIFIYRKDLRRRMLRVSSLIAPMGPVSEIWYLADYWHRQTVTGSGFGVEDFIFAFAVGGISYSCYKLLTGKRVQLSESIRPRFWLILAFPIIILICLVGLTHMSSLNSIVSTTIGFCIFALLVWWQRPDLIGPSLITGLILLILFFSIYQVLQLIYPGVLLSWCTGCNPSHIRILGVNLEELIWDGSWGLVGGVIDEAVSGKVFVPAQSTAK